MNQLLEVCLLTVTLAIRMNPSVAAAFWVAAPLNSGFEAGSGKGREGKIRAVPQELESGISVELPATRNAAAMPGADQEDALMITVAEDGSVYIGENPVSSAALVEEVKTRLSNPTDKKLYLKADARIQYASLEKVLDALRAAGVRALLVLTRQRDASEADAPVAPKGLEVLLVPPVAAGAEPMVVELLDSGKLWPMLEIDHHNIAWAALERTLGRFLENRAETAVRLKADAQLPFALVVDVSDACRSIGAKVVLGTAEPERDGGNQNLASGASPSAGPRSYRPCRTWRRAPAHHRVA
jgi:biopolymer transport protein TolR